jgi:hypothetical protein
MNCPPEIAEIIFEILRNGLLRIRLTGWRGDAHRCAVEADHLHNLPRLLTQFSADSLRYYWEVERPSFLNQTTNDFLPGFEELWNRLACFVEAGPSRRVGAEETQRANP